MLLANFLVAQQLLLHAKSRAFLRSHPSPLEDGLTSFVEICQTHGIAMSADTAGDLYRSILAVEQEVGAGHGSSAGGAVAAAAAGAKTPAQQQWVIDMLYHLVIKPMQPASYIVAGDHASPSAWRHYALNIPYYTHFTSPIRRYADVMVHRLLQVRSFDRARCPFFFPSSPRCSFCPLTEPRSPPLAHHRPAQATLTDEAAESAALAGRDVEAASLGLRAETMYKAVGKPADVAAVAEHCNDRKRAADSASMRSDEVFFCVRLKNMVARGECDGLRTSGICLGVGGKFMTVFVPECAKECVALRRLRCTWRDAPVGAPFAVSASSSARDACATSAGG